MPSIQQLSMQQPGLQGYAGMNPQKKRSGIGEFFLGKQQQYNQIPTQTPQAMQLLQQLLQSGGEQIQNPSAGFQPIADQARQQFNTQTVPGLAERFTSLGSGGSQRSSAFQGALGSAGAGLESDLASMQAQYGLQNRQGLLQQLQLGLTPQFETVNEEGSSGFLLNLLSSILGSGGQALAGSFGQQAGNYMGNKAFGSQGQSPEIAQLLKLIAGGI